jgi:SAM-dependent methyltransferase
MIGRPEVGIFDVKSNYDLEIRLAHSAVDGIHDLFTRRGSMDFRMHERMMDLIRPIITAYPEAHWLTIGEEGQDGWMLRQRGAAAVTASSLSDVRLQKAAELGFLPGMPVRALNAEHLDCADAAFDLVLCRQAYHHVRRAPLAFYEFMRVSRRGFVLIEPIEGPRRPLEFARALAKMALRHRSPIYDLFEPSGNYIYRVSERDVFRMLTALQVPWFAIKTFNTFYLRWLAAQPRSSLLARAIYNLGVGLQDFLCLCRLMNPGLCIAFVPTEEDPRRAREVLEKARFRIVETPKNPYAAAGEMAAPGLGD